MNTPISWIRAYVPDLDCTIQEYVDKMTLSGSNVECYEELDKNLEKIVVGKILSIEKHPDADKLIVCQVDVGTENVQIVTGAKNVSEGDLVPVVLAGGGKWPAAMTEAQTRKRELKSKKESFGECRPLA